MKRAIVTGCSGLVGSQSVDYLVGKGFHVIGIDNHMRGYFFGKDHSTQMLSEQFIQKYRNFEFHNLDIRDLPSLDDIFKKNKNEIKIIIHAAAQPSHDWATKEPITDFTINANGTLNLLELTRKYCSEATFIFTSTNKVYGDTPNKLKLTEGSTRFEYYENNLLSNGIDEKMSIDNSTHSLFGVSKTSADLLCQEYGRYFGMNVGIFRGGCLTGPNHKGAELHGFLSHLINCIIHDKQYTIYGYNGKQVRDNIHSKDLVDGFWLFHESPKQGEVYNIGGGRENSISIIESIQMINIILNKNWGNYKLSEKYRKGDHIWWITDTTKFETDYPKWKISMSLENTIRDIIQEILKK